jgi:chromosome partitioning protein
MTKVIGIVQLKGGAGRSTLATNLGALLAREAPTAIVDCDMPQGTTASWYSLREAEGRTEGLALATVETARELIATIESLDHDYVVIDAPPRIAEVTRAILMLSDLLLIPLGASAAEIWATTDLLDTIEEAQGQRQELKSRIVWNKFRAYTKSAPELRDAVKKELKAPSLKNTIGYRVAYSEALARGLAVDEWTDKVAKDEIRAVVAEVQRLVSR